MEDIICCVDAPSKHNQVIPRACAQFSFEVHSIEVQLCTWNYSPVANTIKTNSNLPQVLVNRVISLLLSTADGVYTVCWLRIN